jgi:hypothetical protein
MTFLLLRQSGYNYMQHAHAFHAKNAAGTPWRTLPAVSCRGPK